MSLIIGLVETGVDYTSTPVMFLDLHENTTNKLYKGSIDIWLNFGFNISNIVRTYIEKKIYTIQHYDCNRIELCFHITQLIDSDGATCNVDIKQIAKFTVCDDTTNVT